MLTAKAAEGDRVLGLETGADDYVVKPFSVKEVIARIRAVLRRSETETSAKYNDARLAVDFADMRVTCFDRAVKLTRKEFALLEHLINNSGRVSSRQQLLDNVWGYSYFGDTRTLDVHIRRLRQKLDDCGKCIETVVGVGYRFIGCK
jgi:DNA-binding response OmpR family regulator